MDTALNRTGVAEVAEITRAGHKLAITTVPAEPSHVYWMTKPDGAVERVAAELPPINDRLDNPYELLSYLKDLERREIDAKRGLILASNNAVEYRYELAGSRALASVPLHTSAAWDAVNGLWNEGQGTQVSQANLYRMLRVTLKGTLAMGNTLPNIVRSMKWLDSNQVEQTIDQAKKTLGASIAAEVQARDGTPIPESFEVTLSIFDNFVHPVTINVDLDMLPNLKTFWLTPYPGELERAMQNTLEAITSIYDGAKVPAYIAECLPG